MTRHNFVKLCILCLFFGATNAHAQTDGAPREDSSQATAESSEFDSFSGLRAELLAKIGNATSKVFIATDFMTDAEIVSSLYIAQYRKVKIMVLLGRAKATNILSRLSYLKQVNIPVAIRPRNFYPKSPTIVLIDDKLISISSDLDYLSRHRKFTMEQLPAEDILNFETAMLEASKDSNVPDTSPLPLVGGQRPGRNRAVNAQPATGSTGSEAAQTASPLPESSGSSGVSGISSATGNSKAEGAYRYKAVKQRPDSGIPTKLPKMTISQEREKNKVSETEKNEAISTESP